MQPVASQQLSEETITDPMLAASSRRGSHESLLGNGGGVELHEVIPAASAIAGRVSASQELPYMTPPIIPPQQQQQQQAHHQPPPTQHFSGDSQDSSSN